MNRRQTIDWTRATTSHKPHVNPARMPSHGSWPTSPCGQTSRPRPIFVARYPEVIVYRGGCDLSHLVAQADNYNANLPRQSSPVQQAFVFAHPRLDYADSGEFGGHQSASNVAGAIICNLLSMVRVHYLMSFRSANMYYRLSLTLLVIKVTTCWSFGERAWLA